MVDVFFLVVFVVFDLPEEAFVLGQVLVEVVLDVPVAVLEAFDALGEVLVVFGELDILDFELLDPAGEVELHLFADFVGVCESFVDGEVVFETGVLCDEVAVFSLEALESVLELFVDIAGLALAGD
jgi:hypothetical protein